MLSDDLFRSGSAPPTVDGSLAAAAGIAGGEADMTADPAYVSYYYSHMKMNPRLPPPTLSKEDWRMMQQLGERRRSAVVEPRRAPGSGEWLDRGEERMIARPKSFAEIFQDDLGSTVPIYGHSSRPASRNTFNDEGSVGTHRAVHHETSSVDLLQSGGNVQTVAGLQNIGVPTSHSFASVVGSSLSRSTTPDPQLVVRAPSPGLAPIGVRNNITNGNTNTSSCATNSVPHTVAESDDILAALSRMSLTAGAVNADNPEQSKFQQEINDHQNSLYDLQGGQNYNNQHSLLKKSDPAHFGMSGFPQSVKSLYSDSSNRFGGSVALRDSASRPGAQMKLQPTLPSATYLKGQSAPSGANLGGSSPYQNGDGVNGTFNGYGMGGYSPASPLMMEDHFGVANLPPLFDDPAVASTIATLGIDCSSRVLGGGGGLPGANVTGHNNLPNLNSFGNHNSTSVFQTPPADPLYLQYLKAAGYAGQIGANYGDSSMERVDSSYLNFLEVQKACLGALLQSQEQYGMPYLAKPAAPNLAYYEDPLYGLAATHPGKNRLAAPILPVSPVGPGSPLRHGERNIRFPSGLRSINGGVMGWHTDFGGGMDENFPCSLLEEFKNNKTRCFELSEIAGHVVDFSADQYGSRFIQQKLETATNAEKDMFYEEIMSQALSLMTDVFGNYVVQRFFEHGSAAQIRELANQLNGHVLALSLQMYGCRVIQKAVEVVGLDQKTKMVVYVIKMVIMLFRNASSVFLRMQFTLSFHPSMIKS